jgi:hypothetical protein
LALYRRRRTVKRASGEGEAGAADGGEMTSVGRAVGLSARGMQASGQADPDRALGLALPFFFRFFFELLTVTSGR